MSSTKATVLKLIERAVHPNTPEKEALSSALIACKKIYAAKLLEQSTPEDEPWVVFDRPLACEWATQSSYVFSPARPWDMPRPYFNERFEVPNHAIVEMRWMSKEERERHKFRGHTVVSYLKVDRAWYERPAKRGKKR